MSLALADFLPAGESLPAFNAGCNLTATVLMLAGIAAIKQRAERAHAALMILAFVASALFLAGYLTYHFGVQEELGPTTFRRTGVVKGLYLAMLLSHIVLAIVNLPMVLTTFFLAARKRWTAHRRLARWTFPIWLYVSVTGVLVYLALYHFNPPAAG